MTIRALIADDSRVDREILAELLDSVGIHDVATAKDGNEAAELFGQERFDLVVTDWCMPNRTGLDVVRTIRANGSRVPILMVTGESEEEKMAAATAAGVSDYFTKPINPAAFIGAVAKHLDGLMTITLPPEYARYVGEPSPGA